MRTKFLAIFAIALLILVGYLAGIQFGVYNARNIGIYIAKSDTCKGIGLEIKGHPGFFTQLDC
jgi:hypothetical protein